MPGYQHTMYVVIVKEGFMTTFITASASRLCLHVMHGLSFQFKVCILALLSQVISPCTSFFPLQQQGLHNLRVIVAPVTMATLTPVATTRCDWRHRRLRRKSPRVPRKNSPTTPPDEELKCLLLCPPRRTQAKEAVQRRGWRCRSTIISIGLKKRAISTQRQMR